MKNLLLRIDQFFGKPLLAVYENYLLLKRFSYFNNELNSRKKIYGDIFDSNSPHLKSLQKNGFVVIKNFIEVEKLLKVKQEFDNFLDTGTNLLPVSNDSVRPKNDLGKSVVFLDDSDLSLGQKHCKNYTNNMALKDPLLNIPMITSIAFNPNLLDFTSFYFGTLSGLGGLNLRKSFVNSLPEFDTQYFHVDPNSAKFLKCFFYLNDVHKDGGPFCYVKGSHKKKFVGYTRKYRWTLDEILQHFPHESIVDITANVGDLIIADTNGFHRGNPIKSNDRTMLTLDYLIHPEFDGSSHSFKIWKSDVDCLNENYKGATDFLDVVN